MKEKIEELLKVLGVENTPQNLEILQAWVRRNSKLVTGAFSIDPLLIGEDKKKEWAHNYTRACLEIGRLALNSCGEIVREEAGLSSKLDVYKPHILVWDLSVKGQPIVAKSPGDIQ